MRRRLGATSQTPLRFLSSVVHAAGGRPCAPMLTRPKLPGHAWGDVAGRAPRVRLCGRFTRRLLPALRRLER
jgi:hypothetical protein